MDLCGEQPGEVALVLAEGRTLDLFWDWPFGASAVTIEEENQAALGAWVVVVASVTASDGSYEWLSSFASGASVKARIRRLGSDAGCSVVSEAVELG